MVGKVFKSSKQQYEEWVKLNPSRKFSIEELSEHDLVMRNRLVRELDFLSPMDQREYMGVRKFDEVNQYYKERDIEEIQKVKDNLWKPTGRSDFLRIEPELILCSDGIKIRQTDFFGEERFVDYKTEEKYSRIWDIMRTCISSHSNQGQVGRQLRYIVRDKVTRSYLGIIMIASCLLLVSPRNKRIFGDPETNPLATKERIKCFAENTGRGVNMGTASTIVSTQPFGEYFNGGKLLSLLCISKKVQDDWYKRYGDVLVSVDTTSLYGARSKDGHKKPSQYDLLKPYWRNVGETEGETELRPREQTYEKLKIWYRKRNPQRYFRLMREINEKGQSTVRDKKQDFIKECFKTLGLKNTHKTISGHKRGVYLSLLYENSDLFLRYKIDEKDLIPAFDNSIETLVEFWRYGFEKPSLKQEVNPNIQKLFLKKYKNQKNASARRRIEQMRKRKKKYIPSMHEWYGDMVGKKWKECREEFIDKVGRTTN